eukprot:COSAG01_NODE_3237_length_6370_cov_4.236007_5_plen_382_part_00
MADAADMNGNFAQYFFCSPEIFVAPVVQNSSIISPSTQYGGLAEKTVWVPPGEWLELPTGEVFSGGSKKTVSKYYDLTEIPVFVKVGSMLPSTSLKIGRSIGQASRPLEDLEFSIYGVPAANCSGSASVYEDDGNSTAYVSSNSFARTVAQYKLDGGTLTFTVSTTAANVLGELDASKALPAAIPTARPYTLRLINAMPPSSVSVNGQLIPFSRYKVSSLVGHPTPSWHYDGEEMTVVVNAAPTATASVTTIMVAGATFPPHVVGMKGKMKHAVLSKDNIDETRQTPGAHTPYPGGAMISKAASTPQALAYLAGQPTKSALFEFNHLITNFTNVMHAAIGEIEEMIDKENLPMGAMWQRLQYSLAILCTTDAKPGMKSCSP